MSESQLSSLGFPMALRMALLDLSKGSAEPAAPAPAPVPKTVAPPAPSQEEIELAMVEASVKKKIKDFAETSGADQASRSLKTISKILGNILKDPDDVKKQELKYENAVMKRDITPFKDAGDLLVMVSKKRAELVRRASSSQTSHSKSPSSSLRSSTECSCSVSPRASSWRPRLRNTNSILTSRT